MQGVAIYDPPKPGLPFLVASFSEHGVEVIEARDKTAARELVMKLRTAIDTIGRSPYRRRSAIESL